MDHLHRVLCLLCVVGLLAAIGCTPPTGDDDDDDASPSPTATGDDDDDDDNTPVGLDLLGEYDMPIAADVAADSTGNLVAISGWFNEEILLIDTTVKNDPRLHATIANIGYTSDVQIKGTMLYANHEFVGHGVDVYDVADPTNPSLKAQLGPSTGFPASLESCHNLYPQTDRDLLYCASTATGQVAILSTGELAGTPEAPVFVTNLDTPGQGQYGAHDMYAIGNTLYIAWLDSGFGIYDITDPANPALTGHHEYNGQFTHNLWPTDDGNYLFSTDEYLSGHTRVWDISDLQNITQVDSYRPNDNSVVHNVEIRGNRAYIAHYTEGVKVLDITDPTAVKEIGAYDFYTLPDVGGENQSGMRGNWGVEPVGNHVFVSGMESGLYVLELK